MENAEVVKPKVTLAELLAAMQEFDLGLPAVDFDPQELANTLKDKVDDVKHVLDRLEFQAMWFRQQADPFMQAAYTLERNTKRLKDYVTFNMQVNEFEALPGNTHVMRLQNNPPALEITEQECTAMHFMKYQSYAKYVWRYEWDEKAIKDVLVSKRKDELEKHPNLPVPKDRTFSVPEIPFAKLKFGQHIRFSLKKPEAKNASNP